jgi:hypothetical protein
MTNRFKRRLPVPQVKVIMVEQMVQHPILIQPVEVVAQEP